MEAVTNRPAMQVGVGNVGAATGVGGGEAAAEGAPSTICARLSLDDWRINLIEVSGWIRGGGEWVGVVVRATRKRVFCTKSVH